jgi:hypothetical protein
VKGIDHLVLCGRDLAAMRDLYRRLGFLLTPPALHPFGTGNGLVQLDGCFLELLGIVDPAAIPEHRPGHFSFAAFNRDFLSRNEGLSMLVLDSEGARADVARLRAAGLDTYAPFDFSRKARLPDSEEVTVGFSLAFATHPEMPQAGFFTCQQHAPQYFWKQEYQRHPNSAATILETCLLAENPVRFQSFIAGFTGVSPEPAAGGSRFITARGEILLITPDAFAELYGVAAPALPEGPRFAGFTIGLADTAFIERLDLARTGKRWVVPADQGFGAAIAFMPLSRQEPPDGRS